MDAPAKQFRQNVSSTGPLSSIVGNILKPIENLANRFDNVTGAFSNGFSAKAASDASQALLQPPLPYAKSAVVDNEENVLNVLFTETDKDGNAIEGGISKENSVILKYFAPALQKDLKGVTKGQKPKTKPPTRPWKHTARTLSTRTATQQLGHAKTDAHPTTLLDAVLRARTGRTARAHHLRRAAEGVFTQSRQHRTRPWRRSRA